MYIKIPHKCQSSLNYSCQMKFFPVQCLVKMPTISCLFQDTTVYILEAILLFKILYLHCIRFYPIGRT